MLLEEPAEKREIPLAEVPVLLIAAEERAAPIPEERFAPPRVVKLLSLWPRYEDLEWLQL